MSAGREAAERAVELAVRSSYGRLVGILAARDGDVARAEDALGDALAAALAQWPERGVPERPEAWLVTVARRRLLDGARHAEVRNAAADALRHALEAVVRPAVSGDPDPRLALLFACAHPAIAPEVRTPLMLQVVLGLEAATVAAAFLVPAATMAQRLVRAKAKIRTAGIAIELPAPAAFPDRLPPVLEAIYAAYGTAWDAAPAGDLEPALLAQEALWLARLLVAELPGEPEAVGLLALLLYCESRRGARRDAAGRFVPLTAQDPARWDRALVLEAEGLLHRAARARRAGRFQLEAAIQSAHAGRLFGAATDWGAVAALYAELAHHADTVGVQVSRAAALAEAEGAARGWQLLAELPTEVLEGYQPYWAVTAHLLARLGRGAEARAAFARAMALSGDAAVRAYLADASARLAGVPPSA